MNLQFHTRKLVRFSLKTREEVLSKLTLRIESMMLERIKLSYKKEIDDVVITCKYKNEVIGWSLIHHKNKIMVFVKSKFRKNGIGRQLIARAEKYLKRNKIKKSLVAPWNNVSDKFYVKIKYTDKKNYSTFCMEKYL